ncbi:type II toxin-antitoxin system RelE/ParE family toxin [Nitrospirillum iridis]|uniref:type II toxin-antitoxin system RelE/ParE family toxin n=1 Tax=Nitrospirillum iridis TaxID=765888 RepID=UPI003CCE1CA0
MSAPPPAARRRYEALILQAIRDVAADPHRFGSLERLDLRGRTYHLRYSRRRASVDGQSVLKPRPLLLYRLEPGVVGIVRILHDAMDFERYAPDPFDDQS